MKKIPLLTLITAGVLVMLVIFFAFSFQVRFSEVAVRARFGKATEASVFSDPGLKLRIPLIDNVKIYDKRLHVLDAPETETKTDDNRTLVVGVYAVWRIVDPLKFYVSVVDEHKAEEKIRTRINQARQTVVGSYVLADFVNLDSAHVEASYKKMQHDMLAEVRNDVRDTYGIEITQVEIRRISLPERNTQPVFQQMIKGNERESTRLREEGVAQARAIEARALSAADQIGSFTLRKAQTIEAAGIQAEASILEKIDLENQELYLFQLDLEALRSSLAGNVTIFMDSATQLWKILGTEPTVAPRRNRATRDAEASDAGMEDKTTAMKSPNERGS